MGRMGFTCDVVDVRHVPDLYIDCRTTWNSSFWTPPYTSEPSVQTWPSLELSCLPPVSCTSLQFLHLVPLSSGPLDDLSLLSPSISPFPYLALNTQKPFEPKR